MQRIHFLWIVLSLYDIFIKNFKEQSKDLINKLEFKILKSEHNLGGKLKSEF